MVDIRILGIDFKRVGWLYSAVAPIDPQPYHCVMGQCWVLIELDLCITDKDYAS